MDVEKMRSEVVDWQ